MKKGITFTLLISCLFLFFSCRNEPRTTPELANIFTKREIADINLLVDYFEEEIQELNSNVDSAYVDFIRNYEDLFLDKKMVFDYAKLETVFNTIDKSTFDEIWEFKRSIYLNDTLKSLGIAYDKKYHQYLYELGKNNKKYKIYTEKITYSGGFPQSIDLLLLFIDIDMNSDEKTVTIHEDFSDFNRRVVLAMSVIKSIDEENRHEKWED